MPVSGLTTALAHHGEIEVLSVSGDIDVASASALETAIAAVLASGPSAVIIDLTDVHLLATAGLRILAATHEKMVTAGQFAVVADSPLTRKPIQLTDLDSVFALYATLDDAVAGLRRAPLSSDEASPTSSPGE